MKTPYYRHVLFMSLLAILLLAFSPSAHADQSELVGQWEGTLSLPGTEMAIEVTITESKTGLSGTIDIPLQQAIDVPLVKFDTEDGQHSFKIDGVPGDPTFLGEFSDDGDTFSGDFTQSGQTFPFTLSRIDEKAQQQEQADRESKLEEIRNFIDSMLAKSKSPSVAVSIVHDGELVFAEGFGYRN
ncbi:hypothetical protein GF356_11020, partial [candidate division GN15 bacterium]|nr:hypothetical protein [candidate division GN15 bacterium]